MINDVIILIDKLRKQTSDKQQQIALSEIRKKVKSNLKYTNKLCTYLSDTLDGMSPEEAYRNLK